MIFFLTARSTGDMSGNPAGEITVSSWVLTVDLMIKDIKKAYFGSNLLKANISVGFLITCRINISVCSCLIWRVLLEYRFLALFQNIVIYLADYFLHIQYLCNRKCTNIGLNGVF